MSVRLHLRRIRVIAVLVDAIEKLVVEIADVRRVVRCPYCGFKTVRVHDTRKFSIRDLPAHGRPTTLVWVRRRFSCGECGERHWEDHPEIIIGRRTHVTRRLARQLVRDANVMSIREVARRHGLPWHYIMGLTRDWSDRVAAERRRRRCRVLLVDETSLRRGHRYVTVLINGDTGETLGIVAHRNTAALTGFLLAQGHRWLKGVKVVVSDGSGSYRTEPVRDDRRLSCAPGSARSACLIAGGWVGVTELVFDGLSIPRDECRRCRLWKISRYSKMALANSILVFHRRRFNSSTCMRAQNDSIWPLS
jgi:hypothetical protein